MEGTMGIADMRLQNGSSEEWEVYGRKLLTKEINSAAAGAIAAGAKKIYLCDAHNSGKNTDDKYLMHIVNKLLPHSCNSNMHTLDTVKDIYQNYDIGAVVLIGFHPMESNKIGFASHTVDGGKNKKVTINSTEVGEIAMIAGVAGYFNIPTIAISGDTEAIKEAKKFIKGIHGIATKEKLKDGRVALRNLGECEMEIFKSVKTSFSNRKKIKPLTFQTPLQFEYILKKTKNISKLKLPKGVKRTGLKMKWSDSDYLAAWDKFWSIYMNLMFIDI